MNGFPNSKFMSRMVFKYAINAYELISQNLSFMFSMVSKNAINEYDNFDIKICCMMRYELYRYVFGWII